MLCQSFECFATGINYHFYCSSSDSCSLIWYIYILSKINTSVLIPSLEVVQGGRKYIKAVNLHLEFPSALG